MRSVRTYRQTLSKPDKHLEVAHPVHTLEVLSLRTHAIVGQGGAAGQECDQCSGPKGSRHIKNNSQEAVMIFTLPLPAVRSYLDNALGSISQSRFISPS